MVESLLEPYFFPLRIVHDFEDANVQDLTATGIMSGLEVEWSVSPTSCDVAGYRVRYQLDEEGADSEFSKSLNFHHFYLN